MKDKLIEWMSVIGLEPNSGVIFITILFIVVLMILVTGYLLSLGIKSLSHAASKTSTLWDDALLKSFQGPLRVFVWSVGLTYAAELAWHDSDPELAGLAETIRSLMVILSIAWFGVRFLNNIEQNILVVGDGKLGFDKSGIRAINKIVKASVVITAALIALSALGYSLSGVLAFGGIGGIAVGFAARDLLANFFGGLMIYLDRPFCEGDHISSPDKSIAGWVEDIGWRLTRVRTHERRLVYVPNSMFASMAVENISRMTHRRIRETVGVRYDDVAKVPKIAQEIEAVLFNDDDIDNRASIVVKLNSFGASSVDIFINAYTTVTDWTAFYELKQKLMMKIHQVVEDNDAEIAFPTQIVYLTQSDNTNEPKV